MEWTDIALQLISNGLFPIVVCGGLFWALVTLFKAYREDHKETTEAVKNNTLSMQKLTDKLELICDLVRKEKD